MNIKLILILTISVLIPLSYASAEGRLNCREKKLSYKNILHLAENENVNSLEDFLKKIPTDTLTTYSLVYDSKSLVSDGASTKLPRVVRSSADGKLTVAYTCDANSKGTYGKVEILAWDDASNKFILTALDFNEKPKERIDENPQKCMGCHNGGSKPPYDPRPIWASYPSWPGVYGSNDDGFPIKRKPGNTKGRRHHNKHNVPKAKKELKNYKKFLANTKDNPCYNTLPSPPREGKDKYYPYCYGDCLDEGLEIEEKLENARVRRPNFMMTQAWSKLNAKRVAARIKENPKYNRLKYLIGMAAAGCDKVAGSYSDEMEGWFRAFGLPDFKFPTEEDFDYRKTGRAGNKVSKDEWVKYGDNPVISLAKSMGLGKKDFTLAFKSNSTKFHPAEVGLKPDQYEIASLVQGALLKEIAEDDPQLGGKISFYKGVGSGELFGEDVCATSDKPAKLTPGYKEDYACVAEIASVPSWKAKALCSNPPEKWKVDPPDENCRKKGMDSDEAKLRMTHINCKTPTELAENLQSERQASLCSDLKKKELARQKRDEGGIDSATINRARNCLSSQTPAIAATDLGKETEKALMKTPAGRALNKCLGCHDVKYNPLNVNGKDAQDFYCEVKTRRMPMDEKLSKTERSELLKLIRAEVPNGKVPKCK